jgi:hypothetical protein
MRLKLHQEIEYVQRSTPVRVTYQSAEIAQSMERLTQKVSMMTLSRASIPIPIREFAMPCYVEKSVPIR